jgi:hypothetical protein
MPGVGVALLGRGLVDGVGSVLGLPNFIGCRGNLAEVVEIGEVFGGSRVGADDGFVIEADAVDGLALGLGVFEAGGARESEGGDLGGPDGGAGAGGVELVGEESVGDLGHEELDGGSVLKEGNGDVAGVGEGGKAVVVVGVAEMEAVEGDAAAAAAVSADGAALEFGVVTGDRLQVTGCRLRAGFRLGGGVASGSWGGGRGGHWFPFGRAFSAQRSAFRKTAISVRKTGPG